MKKIALFPGSFDPITKGHVAVIQRAIPLFDQLHVAIGINTSKNAMFSMEQRLQWIQQIFKNEKKVQVLSYEGLTIDICKKLEANFILRGLRSAVDFEYERSIAHMNKDMAPQIETIFMLTDPQYAAVNSRIVREIIKNKGDVSMFVPEEVKF